MNEEELGRAMREGYEMVAPETKIFLSNMAQYGSVGELLAAEAPMHAERRRLEQLPEIPSDERDDNPD